MSDEPPVAAIAAWLRAHGTDGIHLAVEDLIPMVHRWSRQLGSSERSHPGAQGRPSAVIWRCCVPTGAHYDRRSYRPRLGRRRPAVSAVVTGGNFRLVQRLFALIARVLEINRLGTITKEVVETAREHLVIGPLS